MPRSYGVLKISVWEPGSEFRTLSPLAQWAYTMLISQPQISNLGVLPYTPEKWRRFASGLTAELLEDALAELERERYTIVDVDAGELLVRTFVKHDGVWKVPKLVTNARKLIREVESERIREYLVERHPWLVDNRDRSEVEKHEERLEQAIDLGVSIPVPEGVSEGVSIPVSPPRARAGPGQGIGPGSSSRDPREEDLALDDARAKSEKTGKPAAAEPWDKPASDVEVEQAVRSLPGHDPGSLKQILPLALTLPAPLFHDALDRTRTRIAGGNVRNATGLFVQLLQVAGAEQRARAAADQQAALEAWTPQHEIEEQARSYARGKHPWPVAAELLQHRIRRIADNGHLDALLDHARTAYDDELNDEPSLAGSTTTADSGTITD